MTPKWGSVAMLVGVLCGCSHGEPGVCRSDHDPADCPATYDLAKDALEQCVPPGQVLAYGGCPHDAMLFMDSSTGTHGSVCFYDAATGRAVGSKRYNDVPSYCDYQAFSIVYGTVPDDCSDRQVEATAVTCAAFAQGATMTPR